IQLNQVAVAHQAEGAADGSFGTDVQYHRPGRGATHARIGDAHHVAYTGVEQFLGHGDRAPLGDARGSARPNVLQYENIARAHIEVRRIDPGFQIVLIAKDHRSANVLEQVRRRCRLLDDRAVRTKVPAQYRQTTFRLEGLIQWPDYLAV